MCGFLWVYLIDWQGLHWKDFQMWSLHPLEGELVFERAYGRASLIQVFKLPHDIGVQVSVHSHSTCPNSYWFLKSPAPVVVLAESERGRPSTCCASVILSVLTGLPFERAAFNSCLITTRINPEHIPQLQTHCMFWSRPDSQALCIRPQLTPWQRPNHQPSLHRSSTGTLFSEGRAGTAASTALYSGVELGHRLITRASLHPSLSVPAHQGHWQSTYLGAAFRLLDLGLGSEVLHTVVPGSGVCKGELCKATFVTLLCASWPEQRAH